ncbi:MAG TPA: glycosyltransferase family 2 protein [Thermoanaerobaculia bacterium]|nr:glycosyltransferase family 2 protein [Thermoanaerobaculia bacterium]
MKLVIQIPAWEEEKQIANALRDLPRTVLGFDSVEVLVIDDGSRDGTSRAARDAGADHVLRLPVHQGLAAAWRAGLDAALRLGADVIVSTDADGQYAAKDVALLVQPILAGEAEIVVGDRGVATKPDFSAGKRLAQRLGSWVVRRASGAEVPDATSGFRAMSREAALKLNVFSRMTYTIETLIQAGNKEMAVAAVRVGTNPPVRPSRLFRSAFRYVLVQGANILRMTALYKPLPVFFGFAGLLALSGFVLVGRYVWLVKAGVNPSGHLQSLLLAAVLFLAAVVSLLTGLLADLISINRKLLEEILLRLRRRDSNEK